MRQLKLMLCLLVLAVFNLTGLQAQEAVTTGGGEASGSGGSVSYTVGQVTYTVHATDNGSLSQGVQQPYEIYVEVGMEDAAGIDLFCTSYPNPVMDILILEIGDFENQSLAYQLYNLEGYLIGSKEITGSVTTIFMGDLAPGIYFLKVVKTRHALSQQPTLSHSGQISPSNEIKTFKIIKH